MILCYFLIKDNSSTQLGTKNLNIVKKSQIVKQRVKYCFIESISVWDYLGLFGTIRDYLGLSVTSWDYLGLSWTIWNYLELSRNKTWSSVSNSSLSKTFALALVLFLLVKWTPYPLNSAKSPWIVYA